MKRATADKCSVADLITTLLQFGTMRTRVVVEVDGAEFEPLIITRAGQTKITICPNLELKRRKK